MQQLTQGEVTYHSASLVDDAGRVFLRDGRVFRAIFDAEAAALFRELLAAGWIAEAFEAGLVRTWIPSDVAMEGAHLLLEHEAIPFATTPAECSSEMHWLSAQVQVRLARVLRRHGLLLKDIHPWNVMFARGRPVFVDFGSIARGDELTPGFVNEFRRYYGAPLWLASRGWHGLALDYRREHFVGMGLRIFEHPLVRHGPLRGISALKRWCRSPDRLLAGLERWLDGHRSKRPGKEYWSHYDQHAEDPLKPTTPKQRFVHGALSEARPARVLDCAANKGYYAEMAARLGASVVGFDYEELLVDEVRRLAAEKGLAITPAVMDFRYPTPPSGLAQTIPGAFTRFRADVALVLGLCHHLCITQRFPVELFCRTCAAYADKGVVLEYVDPTDRHVAAWKRPTPADYSLEGFIRHFSRTFPHHRLGERMTEDGVNRTMVWFWRD